MLGFYKYTSSITARCYGPANPLTAGVLPANTSDLEMAAVGGVAQQYTNPSTLFIGIQSAYTHWVTVK